MDHEKQERLRTLLNEAIQPILERLDRLEKEMKELKEQQNN
ncbi:hypothetical protein ACFSCZ_18330 [Siminovitchia sediminis]|uniref:Uncharacterized protein n=1 Tax=Siminovitchia sediminis TaxID=1274353 RepID=A0ABW4KMA3_9BACI